jgi:hypothetical protein
MNFDQLHTILTEEFNDNGTERLSWNTLVSTGQLTHEPDGQITFIWRSPLDKEQSIARFGSRQEVLDWIEMITGGEDPVDIYRRIPSRTRDRVGAKRPAQRRETTKDDERAVDRIRLLRRR